MSGTGLWSFFSSLPLVRRVSFPKGFLLYFGFKMLFYFLVFGLVSLFMDQLWQAVSQFYPASGGIGGGFNPPPSPSDNSWIVAPYSEEEIRRGQEVGESQAPFSLSMRDPTTGITIYKAPSPGGRVDVFDIPETPTSHSSASETEEGSNYRAGPSRSTEAETPKEASARIKTWTPDKVFRPSEPEPCSPVLVDYWKKEILTRLRKEYPHIAIRRGEWEAALVKLHEGRGHFVWLDNLNALEREGERCPFFLQLVEEVKRLKFCR